MVDSYKLKFNLLNKLNDFFPIFSICDKTPFPQTSMIFCPQLTVDYGENIYSGAKYSLLSSKFLNYRGLAGSINKKDDKIRVLISFGSIDTKNSTGKILSNIISNKRDLIDLFRFSVVLGENSSHLLKIKHLVEKEEFINIYIQPYSMGELFMNFDIAIGAPGVSHIERMYCGLPSILMPQNQIQEPLALAWKEHGGALLNTKSSDKVVNFLKFLSKNKTELKIIRDRGLKLIDGNGARRISKIIMKNIK